MVQWRQWRHPEGGTVGLIIGDSAYPLSSYPVSWNGLPVVGWGFYIGGNTPHVWASAEVAALKLAPNIRYLVPIFTRSNPGDAAEARVDAAAALARMQVLGQPKGTVMQLDYETAVDASYAEAFDAAVQAGGYLMELYGSAATVVKNPRPSGGYDEAGWTGRDYAPTDTADQFVDVGPYDLNDFRSTAPLWDVRPAAAPAPTLQETDMPYLISVSPDPTGTPGNTGSGLFTVDGGTVTHIPDLTPTGKGLVARFGEPVAVSPAYYQNLIASSSPVAVSASAVADDVVSQIGTDLK
jgi:hypothetical protein